MKLRDVPFWLADRDCAAAADLLDHEVVLGWTESQEHTAPFDDSITFMMVPLYMKNGPHAFAPVIMAPAELTGRPGYPNGLRQLTGAHRLRAAHYARIPRIPAYLVQAAPATTWQRGDVVLDDSSNLFCYHNLHGWFGLASNQPSARGHFPQGGHPYKPITLLVRGNRSVGPADA